jgi:hypothetical protein
MVHPEVVTLGVRVSDMRMANAPHLHHQVAICKRSKAQPSRSSGHVQLRRQGLRVKSLVD